MSPSITAHFAPGGSARGQSSHLISSGVTIICDLSTAAAGLAGSCTRATSAESIQSANRVIDLVRYCFFITNLRYHLVASRLINRLRAPLSQVKISASGESNPEPDVLRLLAEIPSNVRSRCDLCKADRR